MHTCCLQQQVSMVDVVCPHPPPLVRRNTSRIVMTLLSACDARHVMLPASSAWLSRTNSLSSGDIFLLPQLCPQGHLSPFPPADSTLVLPASTH